MATYAVSDLHGQLELYNQVKAFLKPEDKVFFLGDAIDRGPHSYETMMAILTDPQFTYLMGNHEHMLIYALSYDLGLIGYFNKVKSAYPNIEPYALIFDNGGLNTWRSWLKLRKPKEIVEQLSNLPYYYEYENNSGMTILLSHAGCTLSATSNITKQDLIWSREHIFDPWPNKPPFENTIVVHGHTPCQLLAYDLNLGKEVDERLKWTPRKGAIWYCDCHKIDIDMGSFDTNMTILLDLDTFEEHKFYC